MPELLESVTVLEEVSSGTGEIVGSVDLTTVSQQLGQVISLQTIQLIAFGLIAGVILGVAVANVVRGLWK